MKYHPVMPKQAYGIKCAINKVFIETVTVTKAKMLPHLLTLQSTPGQTQGAVLGPRQTVCSILLTSLSTLISQVQFTVS